MFRVVEPVEISFLVSSDRRTIHDAIIEVLTARGGRIKADDESAIIAAFGSNLTVRLLGAAIMGVKAMPREATVRIEDGIEGETLVSVVVRDAFGFGTRVGLAGKLRSLMSEDALALQSHFLSDDGKRA